MIDVCRLFFVVDVVVCQRFIVVLLWRNICSQPCFCSFPRTIIVVCIKKKEETKETEKKEMLEKPMVRILPLNEMKQIII